MITKLSIKLLQIIMYPQLKWYTKICFCGNRTLVQMLLSDKFQKGCKIIAQRFFIFTKFFVQKSYIKYAINIFLTILILKIFYCHDFEKLLQ